MALGFMPRAGMTTTVTFVLKLRTKFGDETGNEWKEASQALFEAPAVLRMNRSFWMSRRDTWVLRIHESWSAGLE